MAGTQANVYPGNSPRETHNNQLTAGVSVKH